ncbi:MAG: IclR family transcriptional regulator [Chloroflexi bacterium]|nr:IclR family transcriptional regulator [Chloroflexota bacterium]MCY3582700.1 IclR family transcriptional regulator [Chloroflexota bacterium]MCY3715198.1 IclR family transcriptional regulator [Chloroflexota bacterium]MDE2649969.1 IclR family transcriptional regulator [Chloroflexota bacterium]MXV92047.1 IclR family transcriptional regulator [Chloroflexota bacterium]
MAEIQTLARGLKILNLLEQARSGLGTTEVAKEMAIDKSSASRLLHTLANYGFVAQDEDSSRYQLGPRLLTLGQRVLGRISLRDHARPYLYQLVDATGECAHLAILAQRQVLYIDQAESSAALRVESEIGTLSPLHCTALGKVLLAFGECALPEALLPFTQRTITAPAILGAQLVQIRQRGYAIDDEEYNYGVRCVAAPVQDHRGMTVGAIGISGPAGRVTLERIDDFGLIVRRVAAGLSGKLGYSDG